MPAAIVDIRHPDGRLDLHEIVENLVQAEALYLRHAIGTRTDGPMALIIRPAMPGAIPPARFRLDDSWPGQREDEPERRGLWTDTAAGYSMPRPEVLRAAIVILGISGAEAARRLGVTDRQWRMWLAEDRQMQWVYWRVLRLWMEEKIQGGE